jgi:hypothetical protein
MTKALIYYQQILALDPNDSRARLALAGTQKDDGNNVSYLKSISPIMRNSSLSIDVKLQELIPYVMELSDTKNTELGNALLDLIEQLIAAHPAEAKAYSIKGDVLAILDQKKQPSMLTKLLPVSMEIFMWCGSNSSGS